MTKKIAWIVLFVSLGIGGPAWPSGGEGGPVVDETLQSPAGRFQVKIDRQDKRIEVVPERPTGKTPHLRMRIFRAGKRPMEVRLHVMDKPEDPLRYVGRADKWNGSLIGFELEWSFDRKSWRSVGKNLKRILP